MVSDGVTLMCKKRTLTDLDLRGWGLGLMGPLIFKSELLQALNSEGGAFD